MDDLEKLIKEYKEVIATHKQCPELEAVGFAEGNTCSKCDVAIGWLGDDGCEVCGSECLTQMCGCPKPCPSETCGRCDSCCECSERDCGCQMKLYELRDKMQRAVKNL